MTDDCRRCAGDLAHCHGTVIAHAAGRPECTEPDCVTPESAHDLRIDCTAVACECGERVSPSGRRSA
jgi:hypothetical protein